VFATIPVHRLAQLMLYDVVTAAQRSAAADDVPISLDDVDRALRPVAAGGLCRTLRFREEVSFKGATLEAEAAGRTLGGAVWTIARLTERIVYAHGVGSAAGAALPRCALIGGSGDGGRDLSLLVAESAPDPSLAAAIVAPPVAVRAADVTAQLSAVAAAVSGKAAGALPAQGSGSGGVESLAQAIAETWRQQGNVLVAVDSGARVIDTLAALERTEALAAGPSGWVALLSPLGHALVGHAASFRDWSTARPGVNPFALSRVRVALSPAELGVLPPPGCVLAALPGMDCGFARALLPVWAADTRNAVIVTSHPAAGTLASRLLRGEVLRRAVAAAGGDAAAALSAGDAMRAVLGPLPPLPGSEDASSSSKAPPAEGVEAGADGESFSVWFETSSTRRLEGEELAKWQRRKEMERAAEERVKAEAARRRLATERAKAAAQAELRQAAEQARAAAAPGGASSSSTAAAAAASGSLLSAAAAGPAGPEGGVRVDQAVLARAAQARARLGLAPLHPSALARAIGSATSTVPDGASALAPLPATARFGTLAPLGTWSMLGEDMDMDALAASDKAVAAGRPPAALTPGGITTPASASPAGAAVSAAPVTEAARLAARLARPEGSRSGDGGPAAEAGPEAQPLATVRSVASCEVKCRVGFLDLAGYASRAAISAMAAALAPRAVVVVGADHDGVGEACAAATARAVDSASGAASGAARAALPGVAMDLGSGAAMRPVRLAPSLFSSLEFVSMRGTEIALVRGRSEGITASSADADGDTADLTLDDSAAGRFFTAVEAMELGHEAAASGGSAADVSVRPPSLGADEDEDEQVMVAAAGEAASRALHVPGAPREAMLLHHGPLPMRAVFRAAAEASAGGDARPSLRPGVLQLGTAAVVRAASDRLVLAGSSGAEYDALRASIAALTSSV